ncbi:MAG: metallophosphoesterase [Candidatus Nanoarchaeia archaeon]|nr:metallophosphoesterase [Candidatus Nanoarchaeia archaeon]
MTKATPKSKTNKKFKILAAGDFHGDSSATKKLAEKAEKEKVDLVILTGDITSPLETKNLLKPFIDKEKRVVFVPGNWDSTETINFLSNLYGIKNVGDHYVKYDNVGIFGVGSPDWQMELDEKRTYDKLKKDFEKIKDLEKKIMVSHLHAAGTKSEFSGVAGSEALRKAIETFQPDVFLSGHIHEGEGLYEKIGKTRVFNVGKKGTIIEL